MNYLTTPLTIGISGTCTSKSTQGEDGRMIDGGELGGENEPTGTGIFIGEDS